MCFIRQKVYSQLSQPIPPRTPRKLNNRVSVPMVPGTSIPEDSSLGGFICLQDKVGLPKAGFCATGRVWCIPSACPPVMRLSEGNLVVFAALMFLTHFKFLGGKTAVFGANVWVFLTSIDVLCMNEVF